MSLASVKDKAHEYRIYMHRDKPHNTVETIDKRIEIDVASVHRNLNVVGVREGQSSRIYALRETTRYSSNYIKNRDRRCTGTLQIANIGSLEGTCVSTLCTDEITPTPVDESSKSCDVLYFCQYPDHLPVRQSYPLVESPRYAGVSVYPHAWSRHVH
jgi:hypothetical protein